MVFKLKQNIKPQLFTLTPITKFKKHLIINLYPTNTQNIQNPLLTLLKNYNKNNLKKQIPPTQNNPQPNKTKHNHPIIIILNPNHNNKNSNTIKKYKTHKKNIILQITHHLHSLIKKKNNIKIYITHNKNIFIPLQIHITKTQKQHTNLFISIHTNTFTNHQPNNSSIFTLSTKNTTNTTTKYLTQTQNTSNLINNINKNNNHYINHTIFNIIQSLTITNNLKFNKTILNKLNKINKLHKNQIKQTKFTILKTPNIPSILIKTTFINNIKKKHKLKTTTFQQKITKSILTKIKTYFTNKTTLTKKK